MVAGISAASTGGFLVATISVRLKLRAVVCSWCVVGKCIYTDEVGFGGNVVKAFFRGRGEAEAVFLRPRQANKIASQLA